MVLVTNHQGSRIETYNSSWVLRLYEHVVWADGVLVHFALPQVNDGVDEVEADGEYRARLQFRRRRRVQVLCQRLLRVGSVEADEPAG